ncbi:MAG: hypothetical protein OXC03_03580 [Flavobacteriaceae bacterium]|nr:hypothetical protein [Flavobacteriaceae bacterium]
MHNRNKSLEGIGFEKPQLSNQTPFEKLFQIFKELITHTSGDFDEAIEWLKILDKKYNLTDSNYTIDDFINDLLEHNFIAPDVQNDGLIHAFQITPKTEKILRKHALNQIFGNLRKTRHGNHRTKFKGISAEDSGETRPYQFGDSLERIRLTESLKNAHIRSPEEPLSMLQEDLVVSEDFYFAQMSTVLMVDISHSMILYGEDRITPAKKVAMALSELIKTRYPKDYLDILVFGNDAWTISIKDLPYLNVGPYHTNTVAGLELAIKLLGKRKNINKQIFMITDGKPSCLKLNDGQYYKNSVGLDNKILEKCYQKAIEAKRLKIPITTFMIASDPYLRTFVRRFTQLNRGKAFYTGLDQLGKMIFEDYDSNRKTAIK